MKKIALMAVFILSFLPWNDVKADVLFEMPSIYGTAEIAWGRSDSESGLKIAEFIFPHQTYTEVCEIGFWLAKSGNPTDNLVLKIYRQPFYTDNPEGGAILAQSLIPASSISSSVQKVNFHLDSCLYISFDSWYVLSRTNPDSEGEYIAQIAPTDIFGNMGFGYEYGAGVWRFDNSKELRLTFETGTPAPTLKEPVIIVPGMLGSYLKRVSDGEEVWPNSIELLKPGPDSYLDELMLDIYGNEIIDMKSSDILRREFLIYPFYENLIDEFKNRGYEEGSSLILFHYDWRLDISSISLELEGAIKDASRASPTGKVNIVAHSMGSIVTKEYLGVNKEDLSKINKIIFAGSPQLGSVGAFNLLNFGESGIPILNKNTAKIISQNMPSVYQLLPSSRYIDNAGVYIKDYRNGDSRSLSYDETYNFMLSDSFLPDHRNQYMLDRAEQFHDNLDNFNLTDGPEIHNLVGCSEKTLTGVELYDNKKADIKTDDGDGTVPLESARFGFSYDQINYYANDFNHFDLISDDESLSLISSIISGGSVDTPNISRLPSICQSKNYLIFSTHSPVNLSVYDVNGNYIGLDSNGDVNIGISDGDFISIGENNFVLVPEGEYRTEISAYATGSFDFKIRKFVNYELSEAIIYENVLIGDPDLDAELNFEGQFSGLILNIDDDGDGSVDRALNSSNPVTLESIIDNVNIVYDLGWVSTTAKDYIVKQLEKAIRQDNKGQNIEDILFGLLDKVDNYLKQGLINQEAHDIIEGDVNLIINE